MYEVNVKTAAGNWKVMSALDPAIAVKEAIAEAEQQGKLGNRGAVIVRGGGDDLCVWYFGGRI